MNELSTLPPAGSLSNPWVIAGGVALALTGVGLGWYVIKANRRCTALEAAIANKSN